MKHKNTLKRNSRFRHNTRKRSKYGGMIRSSKPLSASAAEWMPPTAPVAVAVAPQPTPEMLKMFKEMMRIMNNKVVAIDCEMVGVGPGNINTLAHVAIIDFYGNQLYNKYVIPRGGINSITQERTEYSGITKNLLRQKEREGEALPFDTVKANVHAILNNKTIVGHGLISDFKVLDYAPDDSDVWDTAIISRYMKNHPENFNLPESQRRKQAKKLKLLAMELAGNNIQKNERNARGNKKGHSPLEDARASMNLFRIEKGIDKIIYENMAVA